jgi:hypothetical protein
MPPRSSLYDEGVERDVCCSGSVGEYRYACRLLTLQPLLDADDIIVFVGAQQCNMFNGPRKGEGFGDGFKSTSG